MVRFHLEAVLLLEIKIFLEQGVHSVNHGLDQLNLRVAQTMLVGNIVGDAIMATRFSAGSTWLNLKLFTTSLQGRETFLGPAGEVNVDGSPHACAQVGGAGVEVSVFGVKKEVLSRFLLDNITDSLDATGKTIKDTLNITT